MADQHSELRLLVEHINTFLSDLFRSSIRMSDLLRLAGVDDEVVVSIRQNHQFSYVVRFRDRVRLFVIEELGGRKADIVMGRYALDRTHRLTLRQLGLRYDISRERIRQLQLAGVRELRRHEKKLVDISMELACEVTGLSAEQVLRQPDSCSPVAMAGNHATDVGSTQGGPDALRHVEQRRGLKSGLLSSPRSRVSEPNHPVQQRNPSEGEAATLPGRECLNSIKHSYPRAYEHWTDGEETRLLKLRDDGLTAEAISAILQRQPGGIRSRLQKLEEEAAARSREESGTTLKPCRWMEWGRACSRCFATGEPELRRLKDEHGG